MGRRVDEWDEPTEPDDQRHRLDTPRQDLTALARTTAPDAAISLAYDEGIEEAIRALYVVMRKRGRGMPRAEMDAIVLAVRREIVRL